MKIQNRKKIKSLIFIRLLIAAFLVIAAGHMTFAQEDYVPLNLSQVETALRSIKATPAVKNSILIKGIGERKITFWATPENEKKLRSWGANEALLKAVRENAPPVIPMLLPNPKTFKNALGLEFVLIPKGEFLMGLAEGDFGDFNERPQHKVKIADDYFIGKYEVTQAQWTAVFGKNPSLHDKCGEDCPVENVSWETVQKFIAKLNEKNDGYVYRLPSEAEWEYAARAGITTPFFWGKDDESKAWQFSVHADNQGPTKVGSYLPNAFGLYDMIGNVWEYCDDIWRDNAQKPTDSGLPNQLGDKDRRTMRGGGFHEFSSDRRLSRRAFVAAKDAHYTQGFRLAATPKK